MPATDDEFGGARYPPWRLRLRHWRDSLAVSPAQLMIVLAAAVVAAAFLIRLLGATPPEFRGLVLTTTLWLAGLVAVLGIGWKLAPAAWRYIRDRYPDRED